MKIAIASPYMPASIADGLLQLNELAATAAGMGAKIVCFPETFLPGYPFEEFSVEPSNITNMQGALQEAAAIAKKHAIAIILPMDWFATEGKLNVAFVIDAKGELLGYQSKNQLDPSEDNTWMPGTRRHLFEIDELKFGITICHEGFRYPESVRWAARNGASIVFHPHFAGSNISGPVLTEWGHKDNPYYEKAMMLRAMENTIYFASANYATKFQESASCIIAPDGTCVVAQEYGQQGVIVADIDISLATRKLAERFKPDLYKD